MMAVTAETESVRATSVMSAGGGGSSRTGRRAAAAQAKRPISLRVADSAAREAECVYNSRGDIGTCGGKLIGCCIALVSCQLGAALLLLFGGGPMKNKQACIHYTMVYGGIVRHAGILVQFWYSSGGLLVYHS